uniref:Uncharacterized protein n=1 Tax=Arundo donax TaxID=35708 RepID=A0A0A9BHG4_ARUDO
MAGGRTRNVCLDQYKFCQMWSSINNVLAASFYMIWAPHYYPCYMRSRLSNWLQFSNVPAMPGKYFKLQLTITSDRSPNLSNWCKPAC